MKNAKRTSLFLPPKKRVTKLILNQKFNTTRKGTKKVDLQKAINSREEEGREGGGREGKRAIQMRASLPFY